jgi:hypothetical protein
MYSFAESRISSVESLDKFLASLQINSIDETCPSDNSNTTSPSSTQSSSASLSRSSSGMVVMESKMEFKARAANYRRAQSKRAFLATVKTLELSKQFEA